MMLDPPPRPWTGPENHTLARLWNDGIIVRDIAQQMGRTERSISERAYALKLPRRKSDVWTAEKVEQLKQMHADGDSFSLIGQALGCGRNAAIGKAMRIGLRRWAQPLTRKSTAARTPQMAVQRKIPPVSTEAPPSRDIALLDLATGQCRWPMTDYPPHFFCGNPVLADCSYCAAHMWKAHYRAADRDLNRGTHFAMK